MADNFVDTPMSDVFNKNGKIPTGGPGTYNGCKDGPFAQYARTPSPNAVPEKIIDGSVPAPSGEKDQGMGETGARYGKDNP